MCYGLWDYLDDKEEEGYEVDWVVVVEFVERVEKYGVDGDVDYKGWEVEDGYNVGVVEFGFYLSVGGCIYGIGGSVVRVVSNWWFLWSVFWGWRDGKEVGCDLYIEIIVGDNDCN